MLSNLRVIAVVSVCLLLPAELSAQMSFKKVEVRTTFGRAAFRHENLCIIRASFPFNGVENCIW